MPSFRHPAAKTAGSRKEEVGIVLGACLTGEMMDVPALLAVGLSDGMKASNELILTAVTLQCLMCFRKN